MPIASQSISEISPHSGRYRARFSYTLDDGRKIERGPVHVASVADANSVLISEAAKVLAGVQSLDASSAVDQDIDADHLEATQAQVRLAYILDAFQQDEPYKTYRLLKRVVPSLVALGYTDEQMANYLGTTVDNVIKFKTRWQALNANSAIYDAYIGVL